MAETKPRCVPLPVTDATVVIDKKVWYAEGLRFECTQCGNCCSGAPGYVWLTLEDMTRIAEHLKMPLEQFALKYVRKVGSRYSLVEKADYDCAFLTRVNGKIGCGIYPVRPMQCRTWPFWTDNLKSPQAWARASQHCPGMCDADAPRYELEHIEACRQNTASP